MVGVYSCPVESGNRLHRFMNGLLWAVLTNRTFLYRYHTHETCIEYNETECDIMVDSKPSDCSDILHLSPWVPSFDDWKDNLELQPLVRAEIFRSNKYVYVDPEALPYDRKDNPRVLRSGRQLRVNPDDILWTDLDKGTQHLSLPSSMGRLKEMQSLDAYFVYGMMFESLFTIDPRLLPSATPETSGSVDSYFLHSRHPRKQEKGDYNWPEQLCLMNLFQNATKRPCVIYVMSDRQLALDNLQSSIRNLTHCEPQTVRNRSTGTSFSKEHGPFVGEGYWQDLALASQARNGMIAIHLHMKTRALVRTSSALIRERVEFRRALEQLGKGKESLQPFEQCVNPWKNI